MFKYKAISYVLLMIMMLGSRALLAIQDEVSYANTQDVISTHLHLSLNVDFEKRQLKGNVEHRLKWLNSKANSLVLDTRAIHIDKVEGQLNKKWTPLKFVLGEHDGVKGSKLTISADPSISVVKIHYQTVPEASGLQWLTPAQTTGKNHPFMYSQSQAIHARSWIPVQDTPAMRVTYSAQITTPKDLVAVMSAENELPVVKDGDYSFKMPQAIPPYLIAIGVGNLEFAAMSNQTGVYAEPSVLESAVAEFNDTQAMIEANEKLYGPYRWGRYDLLILPAAFPFGGMENPRLSFITPTVIAGDKSLVNLIAHELAHSWSGNLVTNATWRDLWLNEGFTSYVENRVMEEVFGEPRAVMEQYLGVADLKVELTELDARDTILNLPLDGRDPDDAFSGVPYVKGQLFLMYLEQKFGREKFDPFVKDYFDHFAFKSIDTQTFLSYLNNHLLSKYPEVISSDEVSEWIFQPGLPKSSPDPQSDAFNRIANAMSEWHQGKRELADLDAKQWTVHEWLFFINKLPRDLSHKTMVQLDKTFSLTNSTNREIQFAWFSLAIVNNFWTIESSLESYLKQIGRRKFIVPLYKLLHEHSMQRREWASKIYEQARSGYHPLAQNTLDQVFNLKPE